MVWYRAISSFADNWRWEQPTAQSDMFSLLWNSSIMSKKVTPRYLAKRNENTASHKNWYSEVYFDISIDAQQWNQSKLSVSWVMVCHQLSTTMKKTYSYSVIYKEKVILAHILRGLGLRLAIHILGDCGRQLSWAKGHVGSKLFTLGPGNESGKQERAEFQCPLQGHLPRGWKTSIPRHGASN